MTIEFGTLDLVADAAKMLAFLQAYTGGGTGTGTVPVDTTDYFPADPALAKFPSPEDSRQTITNGVVGGRPYLLDASGRVHTLKVVAGVNEYWINGASQMAGWSGHADSPPVQLLVRQGTVFVFLGSGAIQTQNANGFRNTPLPAASTGTTGTPAPPPLPAFPTPSAIAPGSSSNFRLASGDAQFADALAAAQPGDTIRLVPGMYTQPPKAITVPILLDLNGATLDMTGKTGSLAYGKGCIVPTADCIIQGGTITGTAMDQGQGELTSAIRPDAGCGYLTIKNMTLHGNQCGVGHGGSAVVIDIEDCDISDNGLPNNAGANTHNLYVGSDCRRLTLTRVVSNGCKDAHAVKYRGPELIVTGGTFAASNGSCFDLPDGSTVPFQITGATLNKAATDGDHHCMGVGEESQSNGSAGGFINGGTINALCPNPFIAGVGTVTFKGVTEPVKIVGESAALVIVRTA